uniref:Uncharacterized protein n=1 Tax=Heterorhabditis bacteriophora TaxID=37862 RepID=A0A1I7WW93_HETBA
MNVFSYLCTIMHNNEECRYKKEFFQLSTVRKLYGYCDFSDDDLSAADYKFLYLERCCLSEHGLRRLLEDSLEGRRDIGCYEFKLQHDIDVDCLLRDLPNIAKIEDGLDWGKDGLGVRGGTFRSAWMLHAGHL